MVFEGGVEFEWVETRIMPYWIENSMNKGTKRKSGRKIFGTWDYCITNHIMEVRNEVG